MKKMTIIASIVALSSAAAIATFALGGGPKLNAIFEAKATSKSFTFNAATGSQFESMPGPQDVNVTTGVSDPIHTTVAPEFMDSLAFGQNGRFVEAHPMSEHCGYFLQIGINNLTHFEIYMGVENDAGTGDVYMVDLRDKDGLPVEKWGNTPFKLENGNGTAYLEWDKRPTDGTVVEVCVYLYSMDDFDEANLYVGSLSLSWNC